MATTTTSLVVRILADIDSFKKGMSDAERELTKTGARLQTLGKDLSIGVTLPFLALGAAMSKAAAEEEASVKKLQNVFGASAGAMESFVQGLTKTVPVADDELRQLVSTTSVFFQSMGLGRAQAIGMTQAITKLAGDLAAFNHTSIEAASDALQSALAGRTRGLREFGIVISDADVKQRAYTLGLAKAGSEIGVAAKAQATWSLIIERSKQQQGEAARTINDNVNAVARFKQAAAEASEAWGSVFLPVAAKAVNAFTAMLRGMQDLSPGTKTMIVGVTGVVAAIGPLIFVVGGLTEKIILLNRAFTTLGAGSALAGLGKFAASVGPWGLLIGAALTAIGLDMKQSGDKARAAAADLDKYKESLQGLVGQFGRQAAVNQATDLQSQLQAIQRQRQALLAQKAGLESQPHQGFDNVLTRGVPSDQVASINRQLAELDAKAGPIQAKFTAATQALMMFGGAAGAATDPTKTLADQFKDVKERAQAVLDAFKLMKDTATPIPGLAGAVGDSIAALNRIASQIKDPFDPLRISALQLAQTLRRDVLGALQDVSNIANGVLRIPENAGTFTGRGMFRNPQTGAIEPVGGKAGPGQTNVGGITIKSPEVAQIPPAIKGGFTEMQKATVEGFRQVAVAIGDTLAQNLSALFGGRGMGAQIGGALGGAFGGGFGGVIGKGVASSIGGVFGGAIGSVIPVAGTIVGTLLGGAIGGLFGHHKKKVDQSADSLDKLSKAADKVTASISNIPNYFKVEYYRYLAAPTQQGTPPYQPPTYAPPPETPPGGFQPNPQEPGSGQFQGNNTVINVTNLHINNPVANLKDLAEQTLKRAATGSKSRFALVSATP